MRAPLFVFLAAPVLLSACRGPQADPTAAASPVSSNSTVFQGLRTAVYPVPDLQKAKAWYTEALDVEPHFDEPFYVGFDVGGYELGLMPEGSSHQPGPGGGVACWGVPDAEAAFQQLLDRGATPCKDVQEVGEDIWTATVQDPFGNVLGIIENPHFEE